MNHTLMQQLQKIIEPNSYLTSTDIMTTQQILKQKKYASLPADVTEFLHTYNGISYNGGTVCGIYPHENYQNLLTLNQNTKHPLHKDLIFIGYDDFDYLAYNQKHHIYQIIDKADLEVLEEYQDFSDALQYILKIENE